MAKKEQLIKCEVSHCKYYDNEDLCNLDEIKVCNCRCASDGSKENTLCGSYECKEDR